jgi:hypothetical protein
LASSKHLFYCIKGLAIKNVGITSRPIQAYPHVITSLTLSVTFEVIETAVPLEVSSLPDDSFYLSDISFERYSKRLSQLTFNLIGCGSGGSGC